MIIHMTPKTRNLKEIRVVKRLSEHLLIKGIALNSYNSALLICVFSLEDCTTHI